MSIIVVGTEELGSAADGVTGVEVAADLYRQPRTRAPAHLLVDLKEWAVHTDRVVLADRPDGLLEEDLVQVDVTEIQG